MNRNTHQFSQKERADKILKMFREIDSQGKSIPESRTEILRTIEKQFNSCHTCLLLAAYGLYKNGFIKNSDIKKPENFDYCGFDGKQSDCVAHALDACTELSKDPTISSTSLKKKFGGDGSIYSFITAYFKNGLLNL